MNSLKTPSIGDCPYRPAINYKEARAKMKASQQRLEEKALSRVKVWKEEK